MGKELTQMFFSARLQGINICESGMARAPVTECYGCLCHFFHKGIVSFEKKRFALDRIPAKRKMSFTRPAGGGASHKRDAFFHIKNSNIYYMKSDEINSQL